MRVLFPAFTGRNDLTPADAGRGRREKKERGCGINRNPLIFFLARAKKLRMLPQGLLFLLPGEIQPVGQEQVRLPIRSPGGEQEAICATAPPGRAGRW